MDNLTIKMLNIGANNRLTPSNDQNHKVFSDFPILHSLFFSLPDRFRFELNPFIWTNVFLRTILKTRICQVCGTPFYKPFAAISGSTRIISH